jgi:folate-dependent phosphoribosylglycinamide formyltransferase PurN
MERKWYSLFSHTGSETRALRLSEQVPVRLEAAITNNWDYSGDLASLGTKLYRLASKDDINWMLKQPHLVEDNSLITLNGYMGIVPADVLDNLRSRGCKVYNIHPAPIQLYPELRGKDPQERMYEGIQKREYTYIGVVIHEVDAGVDTGKIVHWILQLADHSMTKDELYERLHEMGTQAWESFFRERMYEDGENS